MVFSIEETDTPRNAGGRHLDASRDEALRVAALELLGEIGYDRLTMDAIAARARAGKAAIYRRWSGKAELVVDALNCSRGAPGEPDTGSLHGDLELLACDAIGGHDELDIQVMIGLVSALPRDAELRAVFRERLVEPRTAGLREIFERAVHRGEIAEVRDLDLVASLLPALLLHRLLVLGEPPDAAFVRRVVDDVIVPLVTPAEPRRIDSRRAVGGSGDK